SAPEAPRSRRRTCSPSGDSAAKLLGIDAEALDPSLHLKASLSKRPRDQGDVPAVLSQQGDDFLAPALIALGKVNWFRLRAGLFGGLLGTWGRMGRRPDRSGQMRFLNYAVSRQDDRSGKAFFQLANVQRPLVEQQCSRGLRG